MNRFIWYGILVFINCLFCFKYLERYTSHFVVGTLIYFLFQAAFIFLNDTGKIKIKHTKVLLITMITGFLALAVISYFLVDPYQLNVDRWSVIDNFISSAIKGEYPYFALSHVGNPPGPMPFYYIVALPFYFFKSYSVLSIIGAVILILHIKEISIRSNISTSLIICIVSLPVLWEIATWSNLMTFTTLVAVALFYFEEAINKSNFKLFIHLVILGLLLSTRSVYALAYVVFFISFLKSSKLTFKKATYYSTIILAAFGLTFLPLLLVFPTQFFAMNPFIVQSSFLLPQIFIPVLFLMAAVFGLIAKNRSQRFLYSGATFFLSIIIYAGYQIHLHGILNALFESEIDLSYFIFTIPFIIIGLTVRDKEARLDLSRLRS